MGFEGPSRPQSIDTVLARLNASEITPGQKIYEVVLKTAARHEIIGRFNETNSTLTYTHNGMTIEAEILPGDRLGHIAITDPITGTSIRDVKAFQTQRKILEQWTKSRQN